MGCRNTGAAISGDHRRIGGASCHELFPQRLRREEGSVGIDAAVGIGVDRPWYVAGSRLGGITDIDVVRARIEKHALAGDRDRLNGLDKVEIEYGCEFVSFDQNDEGVRVTLRSVKTVEERVIEADYLVGADGGRSAVREAMGARMEGRSNLSRNYNIIFHAPGLGDAHAHGPGVTGWKMGSFRTTAQIIPAVVSHMDLLRSYRPSEPLFRQRWALAAPPNTTA